MGFFGHFYFLWLFKKFNIDLFFRINLISVTLFLSKMVLAFMNKQLTVAVLIMTMEVISHQILGVIYFGWEDNTFLMSIGIRPMGGEEVLMILPETELDKAELVLNRIRKKNASLTISANGIKVNSSQNNYIENIKPLDS